MIHPAYRKRSKQMSKGWYLREIPGGIFYTCDVETKTQHFFSGDGSRHPTPKEMCEMLDKEDVYMDDFHGIFKKFDVETTERESVELPPGFYIHQAGNHSEPEKLVPTTLRTDSYIKMDSVYDPIVDDFRQFVAKEEVYRKIGTIYKRGLLLYGPPGEGKTSLIRCLAKNEISSDAVVIFFESVPSSQMINRFKETLGERMKVFIFEELANLLEHAKLERVLDFLDGEKSVDKTYMIATTNYPERLPGNIVERPSRFDKLIKMGHPNSTERKLLLDHYLTREATAGEVTATNGLSTAALKECCFLHHLSGMSIQDATRKLKQHSELVKKDFAETKKMGLASNDDDWD